MREPCLISPVEVMELPSLCTPASIKIPGSSFPIMDSIRAEVLPGNNRVSSVSILVAKEVRHL